ncbi:MAG: helix-turn-helix domain-containing protein [Oscillospiraceae bacterium]|nr:helix-turn-helix domain-containing protein [Oscillospiraceae bacterium]
MSVNPFPVIDLQATGANILRLRKAKGFSVRDLQQYFGFEEPQAIYKWQRGKCLPAVDNLYALSVLLEVPMNEILVPAIKFQEQQASACCPSFLTHRVRRVWQNVETA